MRGEIVVSIREGVLRGRLQIGPATLSRGVAEEDLILGALDRPHHRSATLARHLRASDPDDRSRQHDGLNGSHAHRVGQSRFLPFLLCTQQPRERTKLAGSIKKLFNFGRVRAQLPRGELSRPSKKLSQRPRDVALVPADRAKQPARQCHPVLEDVKIMPTQDHKVITITTGYADLTLINVGQDLLGLSQKISKSRGTHTQTLHQINI
jgi:hypothetical protein